MTFNSSAGGAVTVPGSGLLTFNSGENIDLVATARSGYEFAGWTGSVESIADASASMTTMAVTDENSVTASFRPVNVPGDANQDGEVNALDITQVERIIAGLK